MSHSARVWLPPPARRCGSPAGPPCSAPRSARDAAAGGGQRRPPGLGTGQRGAPATARPLPTGTGGLSPLSALLSLHSPSQGKSGTLSELGAAPRSRRGTSNPPTPKGGPGRCGDPSSPGPLRTINAEELFQHPAPGTGFSLFKSDFVGVGCTRVHRHCECGGNIAGTAGAGAERHPSDLFGVFFFTSQIIIL